MKELLFLLLIFTFTHSVQAQEGNRLSVELNFARYAQNAGIFDQEDYETEWDFINGFDIGYTFSKRIRAYMGFQRINFSYKFGSGFLSESHQTKGIAYHLGFEILPKRKRQFYVSYGVELFGDMAKAEGEYYTDISPYFIINHDQNFIGIAPILQLNLRIKDRLSIFATTKFKYGIMHLTAIKPETESPYRVSFPNKKDWTGLYEPLSAVGLKFDL